MRLVGGSVRVIDEVDGGMVDFEIAEKDARAEDAKNAEAGADAIDGGVGGFAGRFSAVQDDSIGFGIEAQEMPLKGGDFGASAGALLEKSDHPLADERFKGVRRCPEKEADEGSGDEKRDEAC